MWCLISLPRINHVQHLHPIHKYVDKRKQTIYRVIRYLNFIIIIEALLVVLEVVVFVVGFSHTTKARQIRVLSAGGRGGAAVVGCEDGARVYCSTVSAWAGF